MNMNNNDLINDLKGAIESGMILHDKILMEDGIDLNTNTNFFEGDGGKLKLLSRVLTANTLLNIKYKKTNEVGFNNKFIATDKNTYDKLKSISKSFSPDIYIVDDMNKNYVCVGSKDNYNQSYTFIIE